MGISNDKPVFKVKVGNIDVAVWEHKGASNISYNTISFEKNYLDEKEEWQKTKNLLPNDIFNLQLGLQKAYEYVKVKI